MFMGGEIQRNHHFGKVSSLNFGGASEISLKFPLEFLNQPNLARSCLAMCFKDLPQRLHSWHPKKSSTEPPRTSYCMNPCKAGCGGKLYPGEIGTCTVLSRCPKRSLNKES